MKILFVGATGIIGRQVVPELADKFRLRLAAYDSAEIAGLQVRAVDITDFDQVIPLMQGVDAVVNCAIHSPRLPDGRLIDDRKPEQLMGYYEGAIDVNVRGAYHLYEAAARCGIQKFVMISSLTTVMGLPRHTHIAPDVAPRPVDLYACTKLYGENLGYVYAQKRNMQVICLRLGQPYPAFTHHDDEWQTSPIARGALVAVQDVAYAIECAICCDVKYGVYSIVSDSDNPWIDISEAKAIGYRPRYNFTEQGIFEEEIDVSSRFSPTVVLAS